MAIQVLVPLKRLGMAKQRLGPQVSPASRRRLMIWMLTHVITAALESQVGPVAIASSEPAALDLADRLGVTVLPDADLPWNRGLLHALRSLPQLPSTVLFLSGDLPLITAADILALVAEAPSPGVAIARAHDWGTNALLISPADAIVPMFGRNRSSSAHWEQAAALRVPARIVDIEGLALDVDTVGDLRRFRAVRAARRRDPCSDRG